jgi:DUF1680 family protein
MLASPLAPPATAAVRIAEGSFWGRRRATNRRVTIPSQLRLLRETGRLAHLEGSFTGRGHEFWDSDVAKWLEAACEELAGGGDDAELRAAANAVMDAIAKGQCADGYLGSWFRTRSDPRYRNLRDEHELYTVGHLIEACCAHADAGLGDTGAMVAARLLDHLWREFGPEGRPGYCGHPELELALMRLWRQSGDARARELAQLMVDRRGSTLFTDEARARGEDHTQNWSWRLGGASWSYYQAHQPLREQREAVGHAVRALYLYSGMTDLAVAGDATLVPTLRALWDSAVHRKMYLIGGMGSSQMGERFTEDYDLPDDTAYCETCAAIALARWASRMLGLELRGEYADVMERALHNNVISGIDLDGERYFYSNPLAVGGADRRGGEEHMRPVRNPWFGCACCPPNVARTLSQLGGLAYGATGDRIAVHLFLAGEARLELAGVPVRLRVETDMPWDGRVVITVEPERPVAGTIAVRLPGWCRAPRATLDGAVAGEARDGYLHLRREWRGGEHIELELPMPARRTYAHPAVRSAAGRVAIERGPLVYCVEEADSGAQLDDLSLADDAELRCERRDVLGGCVVVSTTGRRSDPTRWEGDLYRDAPTPRVEAPLTAVPYCLWGNRGAGELRVWLRRA